MSYPKNKEEWWNLVDQHWENLYNILYMYLPKEEVANADQLRLIKDRKLSSLFQNAWFNAPDSRSIHSIPSWHVLCDLCSENYVLYEGEEDESNK